MKQKASAENNRVGGKVLDEKEYKIAMVCKQFFSSCVFPLLFLRIKVFMFYVSIDSATSFPKRGRQRYLSSKLDMYYLHGPNVFPVGTNSFEVSKLL